VSGGQYVCWLKSNRIRIVIATSWADAKRWTKAVKVRKWRGEWINETTQEEKQQIASSMLADNKKQKQ
jgi:hypothetical protein